MLRIGNVLLLEDLLNMVPVTLFMTPLMIFLQQHDTEGFILYLRVGFSGVLFCRDVDALHCSICAVLRSPALCDMWWIPRFYLPLACPGSISHAASGVCQIREQEQARRRNWEELRESESSNHTHQLLCGLRPSSVTLFTRVAPRLIEAPGIRLEDGMTRLAVFTWSRHRAPAQRVDASLFQPTERRIWSSSSLMRLKRA